MDVSTHTIYAAKFSEREWKLVRKALGHMAGLHVARPTPEDVTEAKELNEMLLVQHKRHLEDQLKMVDGALKRALESTANPEIAKS